MLQNACSLREFEILNVTLINSKKLITSGPLQLLEKKTSCSAFYGKITTRYAALEINNQMPYESLVSNNGAGTVKTFHRLTSRYE